VIGVAVWIFSLGNEPSQEKVNEFYKKNNLETSESGGF
jgi:uncharacterized protein YneF (UPF0154 family)